MKLMVVVGRVAGAQGVGCARADARATEREGGEDASLSLSLSLPLSLAASHARRAPDDALRELLLVPQARVRDGDAIEGAGERKSDADERERGVCRGLVRRGVAGASCVGRGTRCQGVRLLVRRIQMWGAGRARRS